MNGCEGVGAVLKLPVGYKRGRASRIADQPWRDRTNIIQEKFN